MIDLSPFDWLLAAAASLLVGVSKTGLPGVGILVVPLLANLFGGRLSVGAMLPMLLFADCFAIAWYRQHTRWDELRRLTPSVVAGMLLGGVALWWLGRIGNGRDYLNPLIGLLVLAMLAVHLMHRRLGERLAPHSAVGRQVTGCCAGFSTTVSNAAGPVMSIYMTALRLPRLEFVGTAAWFFFLVNASKLPIYIALTVQNPTAPIITRGTLIFNVLMAPLIYAGTLLGRWMLPRVPQKVFDALVLSLAALAAMKLVIS